MSQIVTAADLQPYGPGSWGCDRCSQAFEVGDVVYEEPIGVVLDVPEDWPAEGNHLCQTCRDVFAPERV